VSHELLQREAQTLIGTEIRTSNDRADQIGELWGRFMAGGMAEQIPGRTDASIMALYCEYEGDHTRPYTFFLGCPVAPGTEAPEGLVSRDVPAGAYALFAAEGAQPQALIETWGRIWTADLSRRYETDYEIHRPGDPGRVDVFVGVV
jgi:predicted transcriptional regulator YdeE